MLAQKIAHKYKHKIGLWSTSACYSRSSRASLWLHFSKVLYTQRINLKEPKKWLNKCRFLSLYWHIFIKTGSSQHIKWLGGRKILIISLHARSNVKFLCMPNTCRFQPKPYAWDTQPAWRWWSGFVAWLLFFDRNCAPLWPVGLLLEIFHELHLSFTTSDFWSVGWQFC